MARISGGDDLPKCSGTTGRGSWRAAIGINVSTDACAARAFGTEMVRAVEGTLTNVVAELLVLPALSDSSAPRLVVGSSPLWTP